ncbi:hypothetical protein BGY98DRAFT_957052 [Russula aff. rugulosa BPL654]|nr:hypothetical protein BGY98DRAFT_957052 [Russula aff. rugulosa BPL654]
MDADHRTPRHLASQNKNSTIVQLLNEASANPVARDSRNQIPYQLPSVTSQGFLSPSPNPSSSSPHNRLARVPSPPPFSSGAQNFSQEETRSTHISSLPSAPP